MNAVVLNLLFLSSIKENITLNQTHEITNGENSRTYRSKFYKQLLDYQRVLGFRTEKQKRITTFYWKIRKLKKEGLLPFICFLQLVLLLVIIIYFIFWFFPNYQLFCSIFIFLEFMLLNFH